MAGESIGNLFGAFGFNSGGIRITIQEPFQSLLELPPGYIEF